MARLLVLSSPGEIDTSSGSCGRVGLEIKMSDYRQKSIHLDKDSRRFGIERRVFSYSAYIPERRSGQDRRGARDPASRIKKQIIAEVAAWPLDENGKEERCQVLENPEPDCYCLNLTRLNIPKAVQYCLRDFRQCPIYKRYLGMPQT